MDSKQLPWEKKKLESDISKFLNKRFEQFTDETGLFIKGIDVPFINVTTIGAVVDSYVIGRVEVDILI